MIDVKFQQFKLEERRESESKNRKEEETHIHSILDNRNSTPVLAILSILMLL